MESTIFRTFFLWIFIPLVIANSSCNYFYLTSKSRGGTIPEEKKLSNYDSSLVEATGENNERSNEIIEHSQELYQSALYKMENDDLSGAIADFDTAFNLLTGCELDEDQRKVAEEIYQDIFNQLVTIISSKVNLENGEDADTRPDDFRALYKEGENGFDLLISREFKDKILGIDKSFDLPVVVNTRVLFYLSHFSGEYHDTIQKALNRGARYLPYIKEIFREKGLPLDLSYLPLIESAFKVKARSPARASGLWQFISWTGKKYGLKRNSFIDERYDPFKSTRAACDYLAELYSMFNDWYLALASYNLGENKILYAIRKTGKRDFWELSKTKYLPRETKEFVPRFLAALIIAKNPEKFGFEKPTTEPMTFDLVEIDQPVSLPLLSKHCKIPIQNLKELNPELRTNSTPLNSSSYYLRVPKGKKEFFLSKYGELKERGLLSQFKHRVRKGETLSSIAKRYNVSLSALIEVNSIRNPHRIRANRYLTIPAYDGYTRAGGKYFTNKASLSDTDFITYKIKRGDTIYEIAQLFQTDVKSIKFYNNIRNNLIFPGDVLKIPTNEVKTQKKEETFLTSDTINDKGVIVYEIKTGDSIYTIARKFNCSVSDIKKWNSIANKKYIYPGEKLYIYSPSRR